MLKSMKTCRTTRTAVPALAILAWLLVPQTAQCFYNSSTGRWLSRDPVGEADGPNICLFCRNAPLAHVDRDGLQCCFLRASVPIPIEQLPFPTQGPTLPAPPLIPPLYPPVPIVPPQLPPTSQLNPTPPPSPNPSPFPQPGGPLPPDQGGPPWPYGPDGDCTPHRKQFLQHRMKAICNLERSCKGTTDCAELWRRIRINEACITARENIMKECYRGGDQRHKDTVSAVKDVLKKCWENYEKAGGV